MYSIYVDGLCVYKDSATIADFKLLHPKLNLTENAAGSLEFIMPIANIGYSKVNKMISEVVVQKDGKEIWSGRPISENQNLIKSKTFFCEGELAYLNDTIQLPTEYSGVTIYHFLESILLYHNSQVSEAKRFMIGAVTVTDPNNVILRYTNNDKTITCINDKLLKILGGHLQIRKENGIRYLDYLQEYPNVNTQTIEYGKNILDLTSTISMTDFATVILPTGVKLDTTDIPTLDAYLTVSEVNDGSPYVISETAVAKYGWIVKTVNWNDVTSPTNLLTKAQQYLADTQFESLVITVNAVDLHYLNVDIETISMLDKVRVISAPHGMNRLFPITNLSIPMDSPQNSAFTLGTSVNQSLTSATNNISTAILKKIEALPKKSEIIADAQANASELIKAALNGFITVVNGQNGSQELLISSEEDYTIATNIWRWNINGLGFSNTGYNGVYNTAITMDGRIIGSVIMGELIIGEGLSIKTRNGEFILDDNGFYSKQGTENANEIAKKLSQSDMDQSLNPIRNRMIDLDAQIETMSASIGNNGHEIVLAVESVETLQSSLEDFKTNGAITKVQNITGTLDINGLEIGSNTTDYSTKITPTAFIILYKGEERINITDTKTQLNQTEIRGTLTMGVTQVFTRPGGIDYCVF